MSGTMTRFTYDDLNRVTDIQDAFSGLTRFIYDYNGNLQSVTDAKNQTTTYTYDEMDRLKTRTDGDRKGQEKGDRLLFTSLSRSGS